MTSVLASLLLLCLLSVNAFACPKGTKRHIQRDAATTASGCLDRRGVVHGHVFVRDLKGRLISDGWFRGGKMDGQWALYIDGRLVARPLYDHGKLIADDSASAEEEANQQELE